MSMTTLVDPFELDGAWEDRAQELKWGIEDRREFVLGNNSFWDFDPAETAMEIEWDRIRLDVLEEVAKAVRNGEPFDAYLMARPRAEKLNYLLPVYQEVGGNYVMPSMISSYVERIDVPRILPKDLLVSLGWAMPKNTPQPGDVGFD